VVIELTAAEMEEHGVQVTVDAPHEPMMVRADAELMQQAVLNLLLNGMQAMPAGGGLIQVRMRREHQFAVVEVADDGEGIPVDLLPRIFELYFTTKPKGSGIGLAMTYRILQLHGGAMEVHPTPMRVRRSGGRCLRSGCRLRRELLEVREGKWLQLGPLIKD
jgi:signal transduction histidine kinase